MSLRYGVQYQAQSGQIDAGPVRHDPSTGRELFIMQSDVTGQSIGAVALWLLNHQQPYVIADRQGTRYQLTCTVLPPAGES